ncbi:MAG: exodeoxyribonuclease III [Defluviitaleaceae bacterium]|nr:exodeoxyribonuclease III [Defluviitaleaceae bacterium]
MYETLSKGLIKILKMVSWNVNGLRACVGKGFMEFLNDGDFDLVGIQETKMQPEQANFDFSGYKVFWNSAEKKGYSGTLVLSKKEPLSVRNGMGVAEHDNEGRVIALEFEKFFFVTVYTPNSQRELARLEYRMRWEDDFREYLAGLGKPVVLCGDLNVAHKEIDLKNPKTNTKNAGFTPEEREKMTELLDAGFIDTFRHIHPDTKDAYTWWSYMGKAREKNSGWRIDYFLVSEDLRSAIREASIHPNILGSDHCPVELVLEV